MGPSPQEILAGNEVIENQKKERNQRTSFPLPSPASGFATTNLGLAPASLLPLLHSSTIFELSGEFVIAFDKPLLSLCRDLDLDIGRLGTGVPTALPLRPPTCTLPTGGRIDAVADPTGAAYNPPKPFRDPERPPPPVRSEGGLRISRSDIIDPREISDIARLRGAGVR